MPLTTTRTVCVDPFPDPNPKKRMLPESDVSPGLTNTTCVVEVAPVGNWGIISAVPPKPLPRGETGTVVINASLRSLIRLRQPNAPIPPEELKVRVPVNGDA